MGKGNQYMSPASREAEPRMRALLCSLGWKEIGAGDWLSPYTNLRYPFAVALYVEDLRGTFTSRKYSERKHAAGEPEPVPQPPRKPIRYGRPGLLKW